MSWRPAKSITVFLGQINKMYPGRSKASDGILGDAAHASRPSDHNPNAQGVVCAIDITHDPKHGLDIADVAETLRTNRDNRIKYVIANRKIFIPPNWNWQTYTGSADPHTNHLHLSVKGQYDSIRKWELEEMYKGKSAKEWAKIAAENKKEAKAWRARAEKCEAGGVKPTVLKKGVYSVT